MGFWSSLGKIAPAIGAAAAIPFTGGASAALLPTILGGAGSVLGGMAESSAQGRDAQTQDNLRRDQLTLQGNQLGENSQIGRAKLALEQQGGERDALLANYRNALKSSLAMNTQDAKFSRPSSVTNISFSGGARPSALGPQGRQAAELMNNQALQALMAGPEARPELTALPEFKPSAPVEAGFWEKLAGPLGAGLSVAGNIAQGLGNTQTGGSTAANSQPTPVLKNRTVTF